MPDEQRSGATRNRTDNANETLAVYVWRGDENGGGEQRFDVPRQESQTVLDVVTWIQQQADASLTYRFACRVGMCGSCAMMVNDEPRWIKDLVTDMDPFFDKWVKAEAIHHPSAGRDDEFAAVTPDDPARIEASAGIECINCAICYAACDTVAGNPDYLGPAALQRAWTLYNDSRDDGGDAILDAVSRSGGCHSCHSMGSCSHYCPNDLDPMGAIAGLKRATAKRFFGGGRG